MCRITLSTLTDSSINRYTRDEIPARTGVWFAGNSCGGFIASLLAYGIGQIEHPLHPWQWMFIVSCKFFVKFDVSC